MEVLPITRSIWEGQRAALVITHPGHELLVHGWLEKTRPLVFVLTSGNGSAIGTTAQIVQRAGARIGSIFGRCTDRGLRTALLMKEKHRFNSFAQELADAFVNESIDLVVGDSAEGFDPAHDLCRVIVDAAVGIAAQTRPEIKNFEFPLVGGLIARSTALKQRVEGEAWIRKFAHCRAYAEPIEEIQRRLANDGLDALREEHVRLATPWAIRNRRDVLYTRVEDGRIPAIQFSDHVLPVAGSVHRYVSGRHAWAA